MTSRRRAVLTAAFSLPFAAFALPATAGPASLPEGFAELRAKDARVARIGYALATGNAAFCDTLAPATGLLLHDLAAYGNRDELRAQLGLGGDIGVQSIVPGSPAAKAGIAPDQTIEAVSATQVAAIPNEDRRRWARLVTINEIMEQSLRDSGQIALQIAGRGSVTLKGVSACATRWEVGELGQRAVADGTRVVIGEKFPGFGWEDELLAAVMAHELAHNVLRHRAWLDARGRKQKDIRLTEREADRLAPWLLANAGYEPAAALRFMNTWGPDYSGGILRKRTHDGWDERADAMAAEIPLVEAQLAAAGRADWRAHFRREIAPEG
ncbi:hypothetical protein WAB17_05750 [Parerythrobacter aurantius]|uniref:hypothetical protein n=1 Tax=Parerythrobacter aurantius TaxID=3127706 RepID=UPI003251CAC4